MDNRGVLWARVSSKDQEDGYSLPAQKRNLEEFARRKGINIVSEFSVTETASRSQERKEFRKALDLIDREKIPFMIVEKVDRVTRNVFDLARIYEMMKRGLSFLFYKESIDLHDKSDPSVHLTFNIIAAVAAFIAANIGAEARKGMKEKALEGGLHYKAPIGYTPIADPKDPRGRRRTVIPDKERAPLVKLAFELFATGKHSLATLRAELDRQGLTTRPSLRYLQTKGKEGQPSRPLSKHTLTGMLHNRFYYGEVTWRDADCIKIIKGTHEPLISKDLFDRVQACLARNQTYSKPATKKWFAFKSFLKCGYCGSSIVAEHQTGRHGKGDFIYYRCSYSKKYEKGKCPQEYYRQEKIDALITDAIGKFYIDDAIVDRIKEHLYKSNTERSNHIKSETRRLLNLRAQRDLELDMMYEDRKKGFLTGEKYKQYSDKAAEDIRVIDSQIQEIQRENIAFKEEGSLTLDLLRGFKETYQKQDLKGKSEILRIILTRCSLLGEKGNKSIFEWAYPFNYLFALGNAYGEDERGVIKKAGWGE